MRPANIVTAFADILAGVTIASSVAAVDLLVNFTPIGWLLLSTFGLYGGGVVFNDVFDAKLDAQERPERAIPSGRVSKIGATLLGGLLLVLGIVCAFQVTLSSGLLAIIIAILSLIYDAWAKHSVIWGPLFMGLCRGGNLLLGCSILPIAISHFWYLALFPIAYIAAITLISQGEVHGGSKKTGFSALITVIVVMTGLLLLSLLPSYQFWPALPFGILLGVIVIPPFYKAAITVKADHIRKAVKRGVMALIILNSVIAAGFAGVVLGIIVLALLPLSVLLGKFFAVT